MTKISPSHPNKFPHTFLNPPAEYRPQPLWVWNGDVTRERITEMLEQFAAQGMGGVFVHPRAGLVTDYLSDAWFDLWGFALAEAKRLGLYCHIYDENTYPSGFAGGHTVASNPHLVGTRLKREIVSGPRKGLGQKKATLLALHRVEADGKVGEALNLGEYGKASADQPQAALIEEPLVGEKFRAHYPYVDLLRKEVTDRFLELTHDRYAAHFKDDFGGAIQFAFADEPLVCAGGLPMSGHLRKVFKRDRGYDLVPMLADLYQDSQTSNQTRCDYWLTVHEQFVASYLKPCHDWCEAHGLAFTGHFHESSWPAPQNQPSTMAVLRWMQAPGNDLLGFQYKPTSLRENGIYLLNAKELDSVKRQCGRTHSLVESTGGGGYESGPREFKPLEDFLLSQGVNLINPHLSHQTIAGSRKYDWPHTITDHAPWFDRYRSHADHLGRVNAALAQGSAEHPILLLHPSASGWPNYRGNTEGEDTQPHPALAELRESQIDLIASLHERGLAFDLGDELMLAEMGAAEDGRLRLGSCSYDTVILPRGTVNFLSSAMPALEAFVAGGGQLLAETDSVPLIDGRASDRLTKLLHTSARIHEERDSLLDALLAAHPPVVKATSGNLGNLCWRKVSSEDGNSVLFLCNPFETPLQIEIDLGDKEWVVLHTDHATKGQTLRGVVTLDFAALDHLLLVSPSFAEGLPEAPRIDVSECMPIPLNFVGAKPTDPNIWVLDYGDLTVAGETHRSMNSFHADNRNWQEQGFFGNLWSFSIQFRQTFLEAARDPEAEFTMCYPFTLGEDALPAARDSLKLAVERARLYRISVNGQTCDFSNASRWFDEEITAAAIGDLVQVGENRIQLHCKPFHALAEIMPVYLLGQFALQPTGQGFLATAAKPLDLGDWTQQGRPFDPRGASYDFTFKLESPARQLRLELPEVAGSFTIARIDGKAFGQTFREPYTIAAEHHLAPGEHTLSLEVRGNLKNLLGPHFNDGLPGPWSWGLSPKAQPPGKEYRRYPTGLMHPPKISFC